MHIYFSKNKILIAGVISAVLYLLLSVLFFNSSLTFFVLMFAPPITFSTTIAVAIRKEAKIWFLLPVYSVLIYSFLIVSILYFFEEYTYVLMGGLGAFCFLMGILFFSSIKLTLFDCILGTVIGTVISILSLSDYLVDNFSEVTIILLVVAWQIAIVWVINKRYCQIMQSNSVK